MAGNSWTLWPPPCVGQQELPSQLRVSSDGPFSPFSSELSPDVSVAFRPSFGQGQGRLSVFFLEKQNRKRLEITQIKINFRDNNLKTSTVFLPVVETATFR